MTDQPTPSRPTPVMPSEGTIDTAIAWHYGDPHGEQRARSRVQRSSIFSNRGVVASYWT